MKIIDGGDPFEFEMVLDGDHYEFPCGCRFKARPDLPPVNGHHPIEITRDVTLDCPLVWRMLAEGVTCGVFQLESRLGKTYAQKLGPTCMEHLAALVSTLRPGCLQVRDEEGNSMTDLYCLRKNGLKDVTYSTEALRPYLEPSYGVMIYQEILLLIAKELAGFDLVKLEKLRKGIGKKDMEVLSKIGKEFVDDAEALGKITRDEATRIFDDMKKSGRYLFNKCIDGRERLLRFGHSPGRKLTIGEMYSIRHRLVRYEKSDKVLRAIWKRQGHYGKCLSLCEDGRLRRNAVVDIQPAGVRELFEILLEDGRTIRVTDNHRFPTNFGEMTTADLMKKHRYTPQLYVLADDRVNGIRGVKDGLDTVFARVKSVTPIGPGETYDVTMESPHHTFVNDQGVVTCNSHAVTYAFNTYESAYFKAHFPHYFYMSYLDGARHKMKPLKEIRSIIREARRFKIGVTAPVFGKLEPTFSTDLVRIRFGLTNMKDVGEKAVAKIQDKLRDSPLLEWSWFDFLKFGSAVCGASAVRRFIQAGAMGEYELPRQRMLAEFDAWSELTPTEREHVIGLGEPLTKTIAVKEKQVRYTEVDGKRRKKTVEVKVGEEVVVVDEARPVASLEEALLGLLARPKAVTPKRVEKIRSLHSLLHNPPSPLKDTDYLIAKYEEEILGIPISTSPLKNVDRSVLNCTIKEFLDGKQSYELLVIGAEVVDVVERTIRNGDNRGAAMGSLVVTDGEQTLDDVVVFSEAWEKYRLTLMRPGILVALGGRRNARKNKNGFVVDKVWTL